MRYPLSGPPLCAVLAANCGLLDLLSEHPSCLMDSPASPPDQVRHTQVGGGEIPVTKVPLRAATPMNTSEHQSPSKGMKHNEKNETPATLTQRKDGSYQLVYFTNGNSWQGLGPCPYTDNVGTSRMLDVLAPMPVTDEGVKEFHERVSRLQVCITIGTTLTLLSMIVFVFINLLATFLCMRSCAFLCIARPPNKMHAIRSAHAQEAQNLISAPYVGGTNLSSTSGTTLCFVHQRKCEWPQLQSCITSIIIIYERSLITHSHTTLSLNEQHALRLTQSSTAFIDHTLITLKLMMNVKSKNENIENTLLTPKANEQMLSARSHSLPSTFCALPSSGGWRL